MTGLHNIWKSLTFRPMSPTPTLVEEGSVGTKRPLIFAAENFKSIKGCPCPEHLPCDHPFFLIKNSDKNAVSHQADLQMTILYL